MENRDIEFEVPFFRLIQNNFWNLLKFKMSLPASDLHFIKEKIREIHPAYYLEPEFKKELNKTPEKDILEFIKKTGRWSFSSDF